MRTLNRNMLGLAVLAIGVGLIACSSSQTREIPEKSPDAMKLTAVSEIQPNLGREILVEGVAGNASLGAVVLLGEAPVYIEGVKEWKSSVAGKRVRVRGVLQRFEVPTARQDEHGNWSAGVSAGSTYMLTKVKWSVIQ